MCNAAIDAAKEVRLDVAYDIMAEFASAYLRRGKDFDEPIINFISYAGDGPRTADPAAWEDWMDAARAVLNKSDK